MSDSEDEVVTQNFSQHLKAVLLGESTSGKTSLARRCADDTFEKPYVQTLGVDFYLKRFEMSGKDSKPVDVSMELSDIGGQTLAGKMLPNYLQGAKVILLVYDVTNTASFQALNEWLTVVRKHVAAVQGPDSKPPSIALVGNKVDLVHMRRITIDQHKEFATKHNLSPFLVSAKTGENVEMLFKHMAAHALNIRLLKRDAEAMHQPIAADIPVPTKPPQPAAARPQPPRNSHRSTACSVQ